MTIEEMNRKKQESGYSYEQISEFADLPLSTVQKVLGGITKSPRYDTLRALEKAFAQMSANVIQETSCYHSYGSKKGEYTVDDYFRIREEKRIELIDGNIYDMATPAVVHQLIVGEIFSRLLAYIRSKNGSCIPAMSPISVQLDCDDKTILEPDVTVVCNRDLLQQKVIFGAPDFVAEVLSPSTRRKDMTTKLGKYMDAGVREYWIIDPDKKRVLVYHLEEIDLPELYTFEHKIPVKIFNSDCFIDFQEIYDYIQFLY